MFAQSKWWEVTLYLWFSILHFQGSRVHAVPLVCARLSVSSTSVLINYELNQF